MAQAQSRRSIRPFPTLPPSAAPQRAILDRFLVHSNYTVPVYVTSLWWSLEVRVCYASVVVPNDLWRPIKTLSENLHHNHFMPDGRRLFQNFMRVKFGASSAHGRARRVRKIYGQVVENMTSE